MTRITSVLHFLLIISKAFQGKGSFYFKGKGKTQSKSCWKRILLKGDRERKRERGERNLISMERNSTKNKFAKLLSPFPFLSWSISRTPILMQIGRMKEGKSSKGNLRSFFCVRIGKEESVFFLSQRKKKRKWKTRGKQNAEFYENRVSKTRGLTRHWRGIPF